MGTIQERVLQVNVNTSLTVTARNASHILRGARAVDALKVTAFGCERTYRRGCGGLMGRHNRRVTCQVVDLDLLRVYDGLARYMRLYAPTFIWDVGGRYLQRIGEWEAYRSGNNVAGPGSARRCNEKMSPGDTRTRVRVRLTILLSSQ
ncbi:hypothetical protein OH77DRAFT_1427676 [Trametes cingulata]|nr:hypothetical protein OH77DRAFT_1427676 [Trametes cingulata]